MVINKARLVSPGSHFMDIEPDGRLIDIRTSKDHWHSIRIQLILGFEGFIVFCLGYGVKLLIIN
jgi:hypothetical protein